MKHFHLTAGIILIGFVAALAAVSLVWSPYSVTAMDIAHRLAPPSFKHPFGTDDFGRDILSRIMSGARTALLVGFVSVTLGLLGGIGLGGLAGLQRGWVEEAVMRLIDAIYAFPAILFALLVVSVLGPGLFQAMVAIGVANIPVFARLTRSSLLTLREREFVEAARALGITTGRLFFRHLLPNASAPLIVQATISFSTAVLSEAALSYLGLGTQPPHPSWGLMLKEAQGFLAYSPWFSLFPGLFIVLVVVGFNLAGDGLRDLFDPRLHEGR